MKKLRVPVTEEEEKKIKDLKRNSGSDKTLSAFYRELLLSGLNCFKGGK